MILPRAKNMQLLQAPSPAKHLLSYETIECIAISSLVNSKGPLYLSFLGIFCNWLFRMWLWLQLLGAYIVNSFLIDHSSRL